MVKGRWEGTVQADFGPLAITVTYNVVLRKYSSAGQDNDLHSLSSENGTGCGGYLAVKPP